MQGNGRLVFGLVGNFVEADRIIDVSHLVRFQMADACPLFVGKRYLRWGLSGRIGQLLFEQAALQDFDEAL